jgi:5'-methylthioadenosine phosphorylase
MKEPTSPRPPRLGIIGGSGVYQVARQEIVGEHAVSTPYGDPSDTIQELRVGPGPSYFFLPRHGRGHRFLPQEVNYRANIHALKQLGVTHVLAISAVGIMREKIKPGDLVVPDQIFDRTKGTRPSTFFGEGIVGHVMFADPFCNEFAKQAVAAGKSAAKASTDKRSTAKVHTGGTYVCIEGPAFSTRSESKFYRSAVDATIIGMTAVPEAKLAREAELCYAMVALATDYDCWNESEDDVSVDHVVAVLKANAALAARVITETAQNLRATRCSCSRAAELAIMTAKDRIPLETRQKLQCLYGHLLGPNSKP